MEAMCVSMCQGTHTKHVDCSVAREMEEEKGRDIVAPSQNSTHTQ